MLIYHEIASKAEYIADLAHDISTNAPRLSITEQARAADIMRQLANIAEALEEIAPTFANIDDD